MPYCKTCPITDCNHHPSKKRHRNGGRSYYYDTWGCPNNNTGKLNKNYHGELDYGPNADLLNFDI